MAQTINRDAGRDGPEKMADTATEVVGKSAETVMAATERAVEGAEDFVENARRPMMRLLSGEIPPQVTDLVEAETDLTRLWLDLVREQTQRNFETMQQLAAARDWRSAVAIQSEFLRESITQMTQGMHRQMELAKGITSRLLTTGERKMKDAA